MSQPLFRPEVIKYRGERLLGDVIVAQPVSYLVLTVLIAAGALVALLFLISNNYTRRETVSGFLVPTRGVVAVYTVQPGLLAENYVEEGEHVEQASDLLKIQIDQQFISEAYVSDEILKELQSQKKRLSDSIQLSNKTLFSALQQQELTIRRLQQEIDSLNTLVDTQTRLHGLEEQSYQRGRELADGGAISRSDMDAIEKNYLDGAQQLQNLRLSLGNKSYELQEAVLSKDSLVLNNELGIREIENRLSELNRQIAAATVEQSNTIRAPIAGTITSLLPHAGERVDASRPVLSIVPEDAELQAHLFVPTRSIGFVQQGQAVKLRYDAYPYQRFGIHEGVITQVSNAVLTQNEIPMLAMNEPVYKVIATLKRQSVTAYGVEVPLKPGILLSADVELDNRSLMEWLLDPLYSLQGKL
jgi:membrane fusion protein